MVFPSALTSRASVLPFFLTGTVKKKSLVNTLPPHVPLCAGLTPPLTLTGPGKSAYHSLCCSHASVCLTTATQMFAPNLKGYHGTVLLGLLVEAENEYFNLNHSQVHVLIWTLGYKRTNLGWLSVFGFLVCKRSPGYASVALSTRVLGEEFPCYSCSLDVWHWEPPFCLFFHCYFKSLSRLWFFDVEREAALHPLPWSLK